MFVITYGAPLGQQKRLDDPYVYLEILAALDSDGIIYILYICRFDSVWLL